MRTTINIEDDLALRLKEEAHRKRRPFTELVNDAIRAGLPPLFLQRTPYRVRVWDATLQPGIDPTKLNQLADELEDEENIRRMRELEARLSR